MLELDLPTDTKVLPIATPEFRVGQPDKPAVLLVHGFTGSPYEMRYLGSRLHEVGFSVSIIRLPGHGTDGNDFLRTNAKDWLRKVVDEYMNLQQVYKTVYVAGLSMGGVLTILLSSIFPVPRIALAAPAVDVPNTFITLTPYAGLFIPSKPKPYDVDPNEQAELQELHRRYQSRTWVRPAGELWKLILQARKRLPRVQSETLILVSRNDQTVPMKALETVKHSIGTKTFKEKIYTNSSHIIINDVDKEDAAQEIIDWFSRTH